MSNSTWYRVVLKYNSNLVSSCSRRFRKLSSSYSGCSSVVVCAKIPLRCSRFDDAFSANVDL